MSAADLKNAHEVHEAHVAHEAKLKAEAEAKAKAKAKPAAKALDIAVKAVTDGKIDQAPDIALGHQIMSLLAQAIQQEAQEIGAGSYGESCDVDLLNCAASMISRWLGREASPGEDDGMGMLMASAAVKAAEALKSPWQYPADDVAKDSREFSADERKKHAAEGNALPDGSYPIPDADALRRAAILARSGHGDVAAAKKLIARRAKELGVANPLDDKQDASKAEIAPEGTDVDTVTKGSDDLAKVVADAVAKAVAPLKDELKLVSGELAKVKEQPIPGGPVLSRNVQVRQPGGVANTDWAAKAAYFREMAEQVTDRPTADGYRKLAREADEKAALTPAT